MRFRTKITLALALVAVFTGFAVLGLFFFGSRALLFRQMQSQVLSIAATAASRIEGDQLKNIRTPEDEGSLDYQLLRDELRAVRDANRRDDVSVRFVYTMRPSDADDGGWIYLVDAEEDGPDRSAVGDPVEFESRTPLTLDRAYADDGFSHDPFGVWLTGNAPVRDSAGNTVALLSVDVAAHDVIAEMNRLLGLGLSAVGISIAAALILAVVLARKVTAPLERIREGLTRIAAGDLDARVEIVGRDEFGTVAGAVNEMAVALRERDMLKRAVARYVSRDVAEQILAENGQMLLQGRRREITVLIADIRNFTAMSSLLAPEAVVGFLNAFFAQMIDIIFGHRGTLDKFLGDGFLAIFGAPLDDAEHPRQAVLASLAMLAAMEKMRAEMLADHGVDLRIGIALHTGEAVVGDIGSEARTEYTAIGDAVNITSRIESLNKQYDTQLLVSDSVVAGAGDGFAFREIAETSLRGVKNPLKIYTLDPAA